jgi:hypothetical protein
LFDNVLLSTARSIRVLFLLVNEYMATNIVKNSFHILWANEPLEKFGNDTVLIDVVFIVKKYPVVVGMSVYH